MNIPISSALAALLAAPFAFSAPQPLISKFNGTGFTSPEYSRYENCEVFRNQVVITQRFGYAEELGFTKREVQRIAIDSGIENVIAVAGQEQVDKKDNFLCDAPATTVQFRGTPEPLVLFASGGCGSPRLERQGPASRMLRELIDQYCPRTNDFGGQDR